MEKYEKSITEKKMDVLIEEHSQAFFKANDLKAASLIGLYYKTVSYFQENELKTRTLIKDTRVWFKEFNRINLLAILHHCTRVLFAISDKSRKPVPLQKLRENIENLLISDEWVSSPEELSLAFMIGYDIYLTNETTEEVNEDD